MALDTVQDYIDHARVLLQDTIVEYRYPDADIVNALNQGLLEARRIRPDIFLGRFAALPSYSSGSPATAVVVDAQYRMTLLFYVVGMIQLRDEEPTSDARASAFLSKFVAQMTTAAS